MQRRSSAVAFVYVPPAIVQNFQVPPYSSTWKSDVLKYAEARDDLLAYQRTIGALGIGYGGYANGVNFGAQATTNYGYSFNQLTQSDDKDLLLQLQQGYGQNVASALKLGNDGLAAHQAILSQTGSNRARVAEILAKGQAGAHHRGVQRPFDRATANHRHRPSSGRAATAGARRSPAAVAGPE